MKVSMSAKLFEVLSRRHKNRDKNVPWAFWHRYQSSRNGEWAVGPHKERKHIMASLCKKAGVRYFHYHALRHFGASLLEQANVPIGSIQRILGHESRTTTEIYLQSIGDSERRAVEILDENFDEPEPSIFKRWDDFDSLQTQYLERSAETRKLGTKI